MGWYWVHIEHMRLTHAVNVTFRKMLLDEYHVVSDGRRCYVYSRSDPDGGYSYFFSPSAAMAFEEFIRFWEGIGCPEPKNVNQMEVLF